MLSSLELEKASLGSSHSLSLISSKPKAGCLKFCFSVSLSTHIQTHTNPYIHLFDSLPFHTGMNVVLFCHNKDLNSLKN